MGRCRESIGLFGCSLLIITCFHVWDMIENMTEEREQQDQAERKQLLQEMCEGDSVGNLSLEDMGSSDLGNLIVDDEHGIIYCYIPKVACTNWKRVMFVLKQGEPYQNPGDITLPVHHQTNLTYLNKSPITEIKAKLTHYTKFMFVRDPFVRLISAYRDKFQRFRMPFYVKYGQNILLRYGNRSEAPNTAKKESESASQISFYNFIQYLLDPETERKASFDPHWRQMHRLCHPCLIKYDFIGHQETLNEDADQLLKILHLQDDIQFPPAYPHVNTAESLSDWFKAVPLEDRRGLYRLYEKDYRLFGYIKPNELLNG